MKSAKNGINYVALAIFGPVLLVVGSAGFLVPSRFAITSGSPAYNVFHVLFGFIGSAIAWTKNDR